MQILLTHPSTARTRSFQVAPWQWALAALLLLFVLMMASGAVYHWLFLTAARERWPVVSSIVRLLVRDEIAQRDRFMRENLDAMAQRVGEMQAKLVKLQAAGERVSGLAGVKPEELAPLQRPPAGASGPRGGQGGLYVPLPQPSLHDLEQRFEALDRIADASGDVFTLAESRLFEARLAALMVPNTAPVDGPVGSGFGFRSDPITGRAALHTGLDFPADIGTPVHAAAGGVVAASDWHPQYGHLLEIRHGDKLSTLYAHNFKVLVKPGDIVKRGQVVAQVGNSGRSTGPHLHFEVLVEGVPQNPARFLAGGQARAPVKAVAAPTRAR